MSCPPTARFSLTSDRLGSLAIFAATHATRFTTPGSTRSSSDESVTICVKLGVRFCELSFRPLQRSAFRWEDDKIWPGSYDQFVRDPLRTRNRLDRTPVRLRSSGIIAGKNAREVSGRAERRTPGGSLESSRLAARCLNSRAFALLLARRDGAQRP